MTQQKITFKKLGQAATVALALISVSTVSACSSAEDADSTPSPATTSESTPSSEATPSTDAASTESSAPAPTSEDGDDDDAVPGGSGDLCTADQLEVSLGKGEGGAAGSSYPTVILTNVGDTSCETRGYPGVSFVTGNDGTQLGAAAEQDSSGPDVTQLTVAPGQAIYSQLEVTSAENYGKGECEPQAADGFRVYPPGEEASLFIEADQFTGCANEDVSLLKVRALQPVG